MILPFLNLVRELKKYFQLTYFFLKVDFSCFSERRIIFDYETYGDSPPCLAKDGEVADKEATLQGVGEDQNGESGILLEAKVMTMSPDECKEWVEYNATTSPDFKSSIDQHLPKGLTPDNVILCTHGQCIEQGADGHCEYTVSLL